MGLERPFPTETGLTNMSRLNSRLKASLRISRPDEAERASVEPPVTCFNVQDTVTLRMIDDVLTAQTSFGNGGYSSPLVDR